VEYAPLYLKTPRYIYSPSADYQNAKKEYQKTAKVPHKFDQEDLDRGFVVTGLWSWSRHPNFAAEQAIWVVLYQWGCWSSNVLFNWTFAGAISYLILFQASTWFTELITAGKYPEYKEYQQRVGRFLPRLITDLPGDFSDQKAKPKVEKPAKKNGPPAKR
jgi:steroid 5-alpha reductase family enzyme